VSIEERVYTDFVGEEGPIELGFLHQEPSEIHHSACGEYQLAYYWDVSVYLRCASPNINLEAIVNEIEPGEQTGIIACLMCGAEPMVNQEIAFSLGGPGHFDVAEDQFTSQGGCADIALTADDVGPITVFAEYEACLGQEPPYYPLVYDSVEINVEEQEVDSVEIDPNMKTIFVDDTLPLTVTVKDKDGDVIQDPTIEWTIPPGGIIAFDPITQIVRGVAVGTAEIIATCEGVSGSAFITVASGYTVTWGLDVYGESTTDWEAWTGDDWDELVVGWDSWTYTANWQGEAIVDYYGNVTVVSNDHSDRVFRSGGWTNTACNREGGYEHWYIKTITDEAAAFISSYLSGIVEYTGPDGLPHIDDPFGSVVVLPADLNCTIHAIMGDECGSGPYIERNFSYYFSSWIVFYLPSGPLTSHDGGHSFSKTGIIVIDDWSIRGPCTLMSDYPALAPVTFEWSISIIKNP